MICLVKVSGFFTVNVQHAYYLIVSDDGYYDFTPRAAAACDMSGKLRYIRDDLCFLFLPGGSAYTSPFSDACAGDWALKRAKHKFFLFYQIETHP